MTSPSIIKSRGSIGEGREEPPIIHYEHAANVHSSPRPSRQPSPSNDDDRRPEPKPPKRIITLPLLRKRSEHNECLVSTLEELALHQEELQSIGPLVGRTCGKTLKILLLQNNVIDRMDPTELKLFRSLEYLNLALNNVRKVEGVGGMEWLRKLDLTLNFVDVDALEESVDELAGCRSLEELFLLGNPCMGLDDGGIPTGGVDGSAISTSNAGEIDASGSSSSQQTQIGWKGCRAYIVARLPNLRSLDGKEIKRSERILAVQRLPALTSELRLLAEARAKERRLRNQMTNKQENGKPMDETGYVSDDAPTHHDPETRTKISNELYDQKRAKEKVENANQPPPAKGEKEWEEEHRDTVERAREREGRGREWESAADKGAAKKSLTDGDYDGATTKKDGGIKQCNQGKYQFWFEEESKTINDKKAGSLIMRVAIPKHLSTSLVDVDVHPTYVSVIIKSKILRVVLPTEVVSDRSVARRSAASGYLELVMPKVDPNGTIGGLGHVRDRRGRGKEDRKESADEVVAEMSVQKKKREFLGRTLMKEAGIIDSLEIVRNDNDSDDNKNFRSNCCDEDGDGPPPLF